MYKVELGIGDRGNYVHSVKFGWLSSCSRLMWNGCVSPVSFVRFLRLYLRLVTYSNIYGYLKVGSPEVSKNLKFFFLHWVLMPNLNLFDFLLTLYNE